MTTHAHTTAPTSGAPISDALLTAHASIWTSDAPPWLVLTLLGLVLAAYLACGATTMADTARRRRARRRTAHRVLTASRQISGQRDQQRDQHGDQARTEVTS